MFSVQCSVYNIHYTLALMVKKLLTFAYTHWGLETDTVYDKVNLHCFTTSADVQIIGCWTKTCKVFHKNSSKKQISPLSCLIKVKAGGPEGKWIECEM